MNLLSYKDVEKYIENKQVFFKKEISDIGFKTVVEAGLVHNVGKVEVSRIREDVVAFTMAVNQIEVSIYEYMTDMEFFAWIRTNFIPVSVMVDKLTQG